MEILDVERIEQKCYNFNSDKKINVLINRLGEVKDGRADLDDR